MTKAAPHASHHLCFDHDRVGQVYAIHLALIYADWSFFTCLSQTDKLIVQNDSEDHSQCRAELESSNFERIIAILGISDAKQNLKNGERDDIGISDGYLQEMRMVCMGEYEMARDEGSASEEELEKMRSNLEAIEKAIDASISGPETTGCILYESAAKGYRDWNDQLLDKRIKLEKDSLDDWEINDKAMLDHTLSDLPEVNPEHIRNGSYGEADHEAVQERLEHTDRVIFSLKISDQGMSDKGFQEIHKIREELTRLEVDITNSLSEMRGDFRSRLYRQSIKSMRRTCHKTIVVHPYTEQFVINELPTLMLRGIVWAYGGMEGLPLTAIATVITLMLSLLLLYRYLYLRRIRYCIGTE